MLKLKDLLVGFNLLGLNPSLRIAHVLWNYRVWHDSFSPLFLPFAVLAAKAAAKLSQRLERHETAQGLAWKCILLRPGNLWTQGVV